MNNRQTQRHWMAFNCLVKELSKNRFVQDEFGFFVNLLSKGLSLGDIKGGLCELSRCQKPNKGRKERINSR